MEQQQHTDPTTQAAPPQVSPIPTLDLAQQAQTRRMQAEQVMAEARKHTAEAQRLQEEAKRLIHEASVFSSLEREGWQISKPVMGGTALKDLAA